MMDMKKIYLNKDSEDSNDIYYYIREVQDYFLFRKFDTITKDVDIVSIKKDEVENRFYSMEEFLNNACYIGESGYYKNMSDIDKYIYESFVLLYKDNYYELIYDTILEDCFITSSAFQIEDFLVSKDERVSLMKKKMISFNNKF